jgi:DNA-directed RNA polymerase subunit RPC12/RpoP
MDELRLDGNAAAGTLGEIFSFEVTTAEYACGECGRTGRLGEAMVYEVRDLGTVVRCPSCDNALTVVCC